MLKLDFTWRFEAGTEYICPINQDLFQYIFENNKTTSFSMALYEYKETIPTLYQTVLDFAAKHPEWIKSDQDSSSLWSFVQDPFTKTFNGCHLWNNLQVPKKKKGKNNKKTNVLYRLLMLAFIEEKSIRHSSIIWMSQTAYFMNDGAIQ